MNPIKKLIYNYGIPLVGRMCHSKNKLVNVIYYHDVVKGEGYSFMRINIDVFKCQMEYIATHGYKTLRFDELDDKTIKYDSKTIVIVFDDGWKSNYTEIYDMMKSLDIRYNIYLTVKEIGINPDYLTWEQIKQMHDEGLVGFGIHTYTHPDMSDISKIDPKVEFDMADYIFREKLGYQPLDFCYPFGYYSKESNDYIVKNTRYSRIYTSDLMYSYMQGGKVIFGRNGISNSESFGVFKAKLKGYFNVWKIIVSYIS